MVVLDEPRSSFVFSEDSEEEEEQSEDGDGELTTWSPERWGPCLLNIGLHVAGLAT